MTISRRTFNRNLIIAGSGQLLLPQVPAQTVTQSAATPMQPLAAQVERLMVAMQMVGTPLSETEKTSLRKAFASPADQGIAAIEHILEGRVLIEAHINPEGRVTAVRGGARAELVQNGWRTFLVKVENDAGITSKFSIKSEQSEPMGRESSLAITGVHDFTNGAVDRVLAESRWIALDNWSKPPLDTKLSGLSIEYRMLLLYSRDEGKREASLEAMLGDQEQDLGYRSTLAILFDCAPSQELSLRITDEDGQPTTASLLITDHLNRVYPAQNKRALPDLWFERHVYRSDGQSIALPPGQYSVVYWRGPEYLQKHLTLSVGPTPAAPIGLHLERWFRPERHGYYSGDTHIHAAGCSHYESPSEGVTPEVMYRQVKGEGLDVGDVLTWGPGYYYQRQFFSGHVEHEAISATSSPETLHYDVEVSGFPSSHCGHLVLLRLKEQDYPGTTLLEQWPSWNIPILHWAKSQGALAGYAHSGHGLNVDSTALPNYLIPPFDSMGANEFIADVTHEGLVSFISGCDTRPFAELNIWYHTLNSGFRTSFVGETDFPCLSDERVGGGRSYIYLDSAPTGDQGYSNWISGIQTNPSYAGDGRSHIVRVNAHSDGNVMSGRELHLHGAGTIQVEVTVCARLEPEVNQETLRIQQTSPYDKPYWHLERARIGSTRKVPVELIINGLPKATQTIVADGSIQELHFITSIEQSSWIGVRILPSSHTNPIFVILDGAPIRASRKSAQWCREGVDVCWAEKSKRIRPSEMAAAAEAYAFARRRYDSILSECKTD